MSRLRAKHTVSDILSLENKVYGIAGEGLFLYEWKPWLQERTELSGDYSTKVYKIHDSSVKYRGFCDMCSAAGTTALYYSSEKNMECQTPEGKFTPPRIDLYETQSSATSKSGGGELSRRSSCRRDRDPVVWERAARKRPTRGGEGRFRSVSPRPREKCVADRMVRSVVKNKKEDAENGLCCGFFGGKIEVLEKRKVAGEAAAVKLAEKFQTIVLRSAWKQLLVADSLIKVANKLCALSKLVSRRRAFGVWIKTSRFGRAVAGMNAISNKRVCRSVITKLRQNAVLCKRRSKCLSQCLALTQKRSFFRTWRDYFSRCLKADRTSGLVAVLQRHIFVYLRQLIHSNKFPWLCPRGHKLLDSLVATLSQKLIRQRNMAFRRLRLMFATFKRKFGAASRLRQIICRTLLANGLHGMRTSVAKISRRTRGAENVVDALTRVLDQHRGEKLRLGLARIVEQSRRRTAAVRSARLGHRLLASLYQRRIREAMRRIKRCSVFQKRLSSVLLKISNSQSEAKMRGALERLRLNAETMRKRESHKKFGQAVARLVMGQAARYLSKCFAQLRSGANELFHENTQRRSDAAALMCGLIARLRTKSAVSSWREANTRARHHLETLGRIRQGAGLFSSVVKSRVKKALDAVTTCARIRIAVGTKERELEERIRQTENQWKAIVDDRKSCLQEKERALQESQRRGAIEKIIKWAHKRVQKRLLAWRKVAAERTGRLKLRSIANLMKNKKRLDAADLPLPIAEFSRKSAAPALLSGSATARADLSVSASAAGGKKPVEVRNINLPLQARPSTASNRLSKFLSKNRSGRDITNLALNKSSYSVNNGRKKQELKARQQTTESMNTTLAGPVRSSCKENMPGKSNARAAGLNMPLQMTQLFPPHAMSCFNSELVAPDPKRFQKSSAGSKAAAAHTKSQLQQKTKPKRSLKGKLPDCVYASTIDIPAVAGRYTMGKGKSRSKPKTDKAAPLTSRSRALSIQRPLMKRETRAISHGSKPLSPLEASSLGMMADPVELGPSPPQRRQPSMSISVAKTQASVCQQQYSSHRSQLKIQIPGESRDRNVGRYDHKRFMHAFSQCFLKYYAAACKETAVDQGAGQDPPCLTLDDLDCGSAEEGASRTGSRQHVVPETAKAARMHYESERLGQRSLFSPVADQGHRNAKQPLGASELRTSKAAYHQTAEQLRKSQVQLHDVGTSFYAEITREASDYVELNKKFISEMSNINHAINTRITSAPTEVPRFKIPKPEHVFQFARCKERLTRGSGSIDSNF